MSVDGGLNLPRSYSSLFDDSFFFYFFFFFFNIFLQRDEISFRISFSICESADKNSTLVGIN